MNTMKCPLLIEKESVSYEEGELLFPEEEADHIPVLVALIQLVGVDEALLLQKLHWMLTDVAAEERADHFEDGRWWIQSSYSEWLEIFCWFSDYKIHRVLKDLRRDGYIIASTDYGDFFDRRLWYTIDYDRMNEVLEEEHDNLVQV
jgi:hypothetical protein